MDYLRVKKIIMLMATNNLLNATSNLEELEQVISDMVNGKAKPIVSIRFIQQLVEAISVLGKSKPASTTTTVNDVASGFLESIDAEWLWATITETIESAGNATINIAKILDVDINEQDITQSLSIIMRSKSMIGSVDEEIETSIAEIDILVAQLMAANIVIEDSISANLESISPNVLAAVNEELDLVTSSIIIGLVLGVLAQTTDSDSAESIGRLKEALKMYSSNHDSDMLAAALILYCHRTIGDLKVATIASLKSDSIFQIKYKEKI